MSVCNLYQIAMGLAWTSQILLSTNINTIVAHKMNVLSTVAFVCIVSFLLLVLLKTCGVSLSGLPFRRVQPPVAWEFDRNICES
jgi:hypothetical protein